MRRIAYLSNILVRIEDFFVACFGLWIDSFCFWAVRPMKAIKIRRRFRCLHCISLYALYGPKIFSGILMAFNIIPR